MNKLITCASVAAVGAAALQAQSVEGSAITKPWSVSAKLRGFYDDNYATTPKDPFPGSPGKQSSWGFNVAPTVSLNVLRDITTISVEYTYDLRWYEARTDNEIDQTHKADLNIGHMFSDRFRVDLTDSFVYSDEPSVIAENKGFYNTYYRTKNNNLRNYAGIAFTGSLTEQLGTRIGYSNGYYDYDETGPGSRSALLDRLEHLISADLRWTFQTTTVGLLGYQFGIVDYTSDDLLTNPAWYPVGTVIPKAEVRNQQSHYIFVGGDHKFTPEFGFSARAGVQIADYPDAVDGMEDNIVTPYVDAALTYNYADGCRVQVGVKNELTATDIALPYVATGRLEPATSSQLATSVYGAIIHKITPKLRGMVRAGWQHGSFQGGYFDGESDDYFALDINATYNFNQYVGAEVGYAYDTLSTDLPYREFDRNRVYFGIIAKY
jgi:hypothetical protein